MTPLKIYLADLHAYNARILRGGWITLGNGKDASEILEEAEARSFLGRNLHAPDELNEWAIHDHEGFCGLRVSEYTDLDTLAALGELAEELADKWEAFCEWVLDQGFELHELTNKEDDFRDAYRGNYPTLLTYAEELFDDCYLSEVPENVRPYINYEAFKRDLECDGYWISGSGNVFCPV